MGAKTMSGDKGLRATQDLWEKHRREQQRRMAKIPLIEKIRWLEEMQQVVRHLEAQRRLRESQR
jgi:hypothetical protein